MNALPAELRTPPLPVIAFVGCPELHKDVGTYFNTTLRPPLFSVGLAEANEALLARLFGVPKPAKPFSTPDGILKADWFLKQRQRRAAVAVAFVPRSDVDGDPSSWMRMLAGLRAIKAASAHREVGLLLVVVQDGPLSELPQDRLTGLWSNVEPRQVMSISRTMFSPDLPPEQRAQLQEAQLRPLGHAVLEAASAHYGARAERLRRRQLGMAATLGACPPEVAAAVAFKLAVLAEFRQDWLAAVSSYQAAAAALAGVPLGRPSVSVQRHAEVAAVAEVVAFKATMLLLHQQRYGEAVGQLASHLATFGQLPDGLPLPAAAAHYGWLARQYQTAAEMIAGSRMDAVTLQAHKEVDPAHLLMSAAQCDLTRKALAEQLAQLRGGVGPGFDLGAVKKGRYLGQVERRQPQGQGGSSDLTDAEFCAYLEAEEVRLNHSQVVLDLLLQAQAMHIRTHAPPPGPPTPPAGGGPGGGTAAAAAAAAGTKRVGGGGGSGGGGSGRGAVDRLGARLAHLIAEQQADSHNLTAARKLLLQAAHMYRRDGWDVLLLHSLLLLRDVCQRLKLHRESLLASLEIASLAASLAAAAAAAGGASGSGAASPAGLFDHEQAEALASAALMGLLAGPTDNKSSLKKVPQTFAQQQQQQQQQQGEDSTTTAGSGAGGGAAAAEGVARSAGSATSAGSGGSGSSSSSGRWDYTVQHLDLATTVQQLPPGRDDAATISSSIAEILLLHKQQDAGWWRLITVAGGFVAHGPDPAQLCLCVALLNNTPAALPLEAATLGLADSQGNWRQPLAVGPPPAPSGGSGSGSTKGRAEGPGTAQQASAADAAADALGSLQLAGGKQPQQPVLWPLTLQPGRWALLHVGFAPRCIGSLLCETLELQLSAQLCVSFQIATFPPNRPALGRSVLPAAAVPGEPFGLQQQVRLGAWSAKVAHVGALPELQVLQPELLLVGEFAPLEVRVRAVAPQPAASLQLSLQSPVTGAPPQQLMLLAALPDGKLHEVGLEGHILALPKLPAGAAWTARLWARSSTVQDCRLAVVLSCPAPVSAHADLRFRGPFEHRVRLCAEAGVHTFVAPSPAFDAVNNGGAAAGEGLGGGAAPGGGSAAATGSGSSAAAGGDAVPLVVGQSLLVQVLVGTSHAAELLLLDAELVQDEGRGIKLLNQLSDQLAHKPLPAGPGSVHTLLLQLMPTAKCAAASSMGRLRLTWRRRNPAAVAAPADAAAGGGGGSRAPGSSSGSGAPAEAPGAGLAVGAAPRAEVDTLLELPQVTAQDSQLSMRLLSPQHVTAGLPFAFSMQLHNMTPQAQELQLNVQEAQGFVFSGAKQQALTLAPHSTQTVAWTLVAHASGQLQLPAVRVMCPRLCCSALTQGAHIHVLAF